MLSGFWAVLFLAAAAPAAPKIRKSGISAIVKPEPATMGLMGGALIGLGIFAKKLRPRNS